MAGGVPPASPSGELTPLARLESQLLDRAENLLQRGDPAAALESVDKAITCCNGRFADRALHILNDALAQPEIAAGHHVQSIQCFDRLEAEHPEAVYGPAARCWAIALNALLARDADVKKLRKTIRQQSRQIQILQKQIEQLKAVDLELETPKPNVNVP
jgi:tetratricopeptide (TPR) repeat protein